jgi:ribosomal protein S27E
MSDDPGYDKLRCPDCPTVRSFVEFSKWEGRQSLEVQPDGGVEWEAWEGLDADHETTEVQCGGCGKTLWTDGARAVVELRPT